MFMPGAGLGASEETVKKTGTLQGGHIDQSKELVLWSQAEEDSHSDPTH